MIITKRTKNIKYVNMTYFNLTKKNLSTIQTKNYQEYYLWQRKKRYLNVKHVGFNLHDGWGNVPRVMSGKV